MLAYFNEFVAWIQANPTVALSAIFAFALVDSLFLVGMFMPTSLAMFMIGAATSITGLSFPAVLGLTMLGGFIGDALSYTLGFTQGTRLFEIGALKKRPQMLEKTKKFFDKYGVRAVVIAPFLGPLRTLMPAVAGVYRMKLLPYAIAEVISVFLWAGLYLTVGAVLGASLNLAAEVATKLAGLILGTGLLAWGLYWVTDRSVASSSAVVGKAMSRLLRFSRRYRLLGYLGPALSDPEQPETPVLAALALALATIALVVMLVVWAPLDRPPELDYAVWDFMKSLHTPAAVAVAVVIRQIGEAGVYVPVALAGLAVLVLGGYRRAAWHWLLAIVMIAVVAFIVRQVPLTLNRPIGGSGARDLVLPIVIYGMVPILLGNRRGMTYRRTIYSSLAVLLGLMTLTRVFLGGQWLSLTLFGVTLGLIWLVAVGTGYRQTRPPVLPATLLPVTLVTLCVALGLNLSRVYTERLGQFTLKKPPPQLLSAGAWRDGHDLDLPETRVQWANDTEQVFTVQWAGPTDRLVAGLGEQGWQRAEPMRWSNSLRWLSSKVPLAEVPILPQAHDGHYESLLLRLPAGPEQQYVLRLWRDNARLSNGYGVYTGLISLQVPRRFVYLWRVPISIADPPPQVTRSLLSAPGLSGRQLGPVVRLWPTPPNAQTSLMDMVPWVGLTMPTAPALDTVRPLSALPRVTVTSAPTPTPGR